MLNSTLSLNPTLNPTLNLNLNLSMQRAVIRNRRATAEQPQLRIDQDYDEE